MTGLHQLVQATVVQIVANPEWSTFVAFCAVVFNAGATWSGFRTLRREAATKKDLRASELALMDKLKQWTMDNYPSRRECDVLHSCKESRSTTDGTD